MGLDELRHRRYLVCSFHSWQQFKKKKKKKNRKAGGGRRRVKDASVVGIVEAIETLI